MTRTPKFILASQQDRGKPSTVIRMPLAGMSMKPLLFDFDADRFRPILRHYLARWGEGFASVWNRQGQVGTTLFAEPRRIALCDANFDLLETIPYQSPKDTV